MKTTEIYIRAFNTNTNIRVKKKEYLSIEDSVEYIQKKLGDTAMVVEIHQDKKVIKNPSYKDPEKVFSR